ncbi:MAG: PAS domain-containing protein [Planctomycetes bacterium]|nr:PAS domain-containing protein [Planctomycetota bacterium]
MSRHTEDREEAATTGERSPGDTTLVPHSGAEAPPPALPRSAPYATERVGAFEFDLATGACSWSAGFSNLLGFAAEPGSGGWEPLLARVHANDRAALVERVRELLAREGELELDLCIDLPNGEHRWIHARAKSRTDPSGRIARCTGVAFDVTRLEGQKEDLRAKEARLARSERRYRTLVAASSAIVWSMDPEGRFVEPQEQWAAFTGQTWEQYRGTGWLAMIHSDDRARVGQEWAAIVQSRAFGEDEARLCHAASIEWRRVRARAVPLLAADGSIEEWIGTNEDVHERVTAAELVRESEERLRTVLRATNDVVWDWDLRRGELAWSPRYAETFGYPLDELRMSTVECDRRVHPDDRAGLDRSLAAALEGKGEFWAHEYRYRHADGAWRHVQDRGYVKRDEQGRATRMIGALQDVTRARHAEAELRKAELLYRELVHSVKAILWRANPATLDFEFVSKEAERLGYPLEQWLEPGFWIAHLHPDDRDHAVRFCLNATRDGRNHEFEYRFLASDGRTVWLRDVTTVLVEDGAVTELVGILLDVSELKLAEARVCESDARLRAIHEQSSVGFVSTTLDSRILDANPAFCAMLGFQREELVERTIESITHPDDWRGNAERRDALLQHDGTHFHVEKRYLRKDGTALDARVSVVLIRDPRGAPACFVGIVEDIAERKRYERDLQVMNQTLERRVQERTAELQAALRDLESFSYSVSHDLRAPLRSMDGFSHALLAERSHLDAEARDWLGRIRASCTRMSDLIDGLLALARLSRDELEPAPVDLAALARKIVEGLRAAEPARAVEFVVRGELVARADPRLARILLENLLGNAWKFTARREHATIELFTETGASGERVYCVRDDGVGFESNLARRLFQPFERLHTQAEFPGSGIGLATVHRIVRRHGGDVWIEGFPGGGACVLFTLSTVHGEEARPVPDSGANE